MYMYDCKIYKKLKRNDNRRAVFTPFSPSNVRSFQGTVVPADPIVANMPLRNASRIQGNIVLIMRGDVSFDVKVMGIPLARVYIYACINAARVYHGNILCAISGIYTHMHTW